LKSKPLLIKKSQFFEERIYIDHANFSGGRFKTAQDSNVQIRLVAKVITAYGKDFKKIPRIVDFIDNSLYFLW